MDTATVAESILQKIIHTTLHVHQEEDFDANSLGNSRCQCFSLRFPHLTPTSFIYAFSLEGRLPTLKFSRCHSCGENLFPSQGRFSFAQLEVVMLGIILLNVQAERPVRKVVNRCVPGLPEIIGLDVPVMQLVGVHAGLDLGL